MEQKNVSKKTIFKKIGNILFGIVIGIMALLIVLSIVSKATNKPIMKYNVLWVLTDSMEPTIEQSSYILVKTVDPTTLDVGDIITFVSRESRIEGDINTHRIDSVVVEGEEFITKGDNCPKPDSEHVYGSEIQYKYVCNLKLLTLFGRAYSTKAGLILTLIIISILVIMCFASSVNTIQKEMSDKEKEKLLDQLVKEEVARLEKENQEKK